MQTELRKRATRVTTSASGTISGTYNKNTNILLYTITWNGLSAAPSAMHFHGPADPGVATGVKIGMGLAGV